MSKVEITQAELLPCPFCGGEARLYPVIMPFDADCDTITIQCGECDAIGATALVDQDMHTQSDLPDLEAEAIAAWNHRQSATTEALVAMEQARRAIEMQRSYGCGRCNGDCGSANPPVLACPMQVAQEALATLTAKIERMRHEQG